MKHTHNPDNNEPVMAFDERLAGAFVPTEDITEIRAIGQGNVQPENAPRTVNQPEFLTERQLSLGEAPVAAMPATTRKRRAPKRSRNHELLSLLKELQGEPFTEFLTMTRSAIESGMRCTRWTNKDLLMHELIFLCDIGCQTADSEEDDSAERIELAMRRHENCPTVMFWGDRLALPRQHDVHDAALDVSLRIHFATDVESCRVIVGWIEEIYPNDNPAEAKTQQADAGLNVLVCA